MCARQAGAARGLKETNELLGKASAQLFKARELNPSEQLSTLASGQLALAKVRSCRATSYNLNWWQVAQSRALHKDNLVAACKY